MEPVKFFKCLSDETRLMCLLLVMQEQELCVCELTEALQQIQPKVSRHLAQLRQCELLVDERRGQWVFYRLNPQLPAWAEGVLLQTLEGNAAMLKTLSARLKKMQGRPDRAALCG